MSPMGDRERYILSALYHLDRGETVEQAAGALRSRFGFLSEGEAYVYAEMAADAMRSAQLLSQANPETTVGQVLAPTGYTGGPVNVNATVEFNAPGRRTEFRTIRVQVEPGDTVSDLSGRVQGIVDDWMSRYGSDGRTADVRLEAAF